MARTADQTLPLTGPKAPKAVQLEGELVRRPRGRPAGSKNKPKPPIIITRDSANSLPTHVMEVDSGCDVIESLTHFARRHQCGICLLSVTGCINNVTLRQPATYGAIVTLHGRFEILSLIGSLLPPTNPTRNNGPHYLFNRGSRSGCGRGSCRSTFCFKPSNDHGGFI